MNASFTYERYKEERWLEEARHVIYMINTYIARMEERQTDISDRILRFIFREADYTQSITYHKQLRERYLATMIGISSR